MCCGQYKKVTKVLAPANDTTLVQYTGVSQYTIRGNISGTLYVFDAGVKQQQYVKTNDVEFLTSLKAGIKSLFVVVPEPIQIASQGVLSIVSDVVATDVAEPQNNAVETLVEVVEQPKSKRRKSNVESVV